jgi:hypothetical protein
VVMTRAATSAGEAGQLERLRLLRIRLNERVRSRVDDEFSIELSELHDYALHLGSYTIRQRVVAIRIFEVQLVFLADVKHSYVLLRAIIASAS